MNPTTPKTNNKYFLWGIIGLFALLFYFIYIAQLKGEYGYVLIQVKPFETVTGWGYEVTVNDQTYIRQSFIPAIEGKKSFKTKQDALRVGNKVVEKMKMGQQLPSITFEDLRQLGILKDSAGHP